VKKGKGRGNNAIKSGDIWMGWLDRGKKKDVANELQRGSEGGEGNKLIGRKEY